MRINSQLVSKLKTAAAQDTYLKSNLDEYIDSFSMLDDKAVSQRLKTMAELRKRSEEHGGTKVHRYGAAAIDMSRDCIGLSLAWHTENKDGYVSTLKKLLEALCQAPDWVFQGKYDGFDADLRTADIGVNVAVAYDSMKELFSDEEKAQIIDALMQKCILPIYNEWVNPKTRTHALDTMGHNWWSVIVAGGGAILKILESDICHTSIDIAAMYQDMRLGIAEWFNYPGNLLQNKKANFADGGFIEFLGYLTYALANIIVWESLGETIMPEEKIAGLVDFFMTLFYEFDDGVRTVNFGDSSRVFTGSNMHVLFYLASRFDRGDLYAMLQKMGPIGPFPLNYCFHPRADTSLDLATVSNTAPTTAIFNGAGCAVVRSGYNAADWLFAMKSGESWNHNHLDAGTFVLYSGGKEIIIDSGTCTYSRDEYHDYYVQPQAHNIVLFDGAGQNFDQMYNGTKYEGRFPSRLFGDGFTYLLADNTGPYANIYQRFYRHMLFLDGVILLIDDLHTYKEGLLSCLLHYVGELCTKPHPNDAQSFVLSNGNITTSLVSLFPPNANISVKTGYREEVKAPRSEDLPLPESPYLQIDAPTENRRQKFINAFVLDLPQTRGVEISTIYHDNIIEVSIKSKSGLTRVICNEKADGRVMHKNSTFKFGNISSDGFIICISEDMAGTMESVAMINGSQLHINDSFFCGSLIKADSFFDLKNKKLTAEVTADTRMHWQGRDDAIALSQGENTVDLSPHR